MTIVAFLPILRMCDSVIYCQNLKKNSRYLGTLRVDRSDLTYIWGGIQYLAVEMVDFLRVQAIINRIKADKENIRDIWLLNFKKGKLFYN